MKKIIITAISAIAVIASVIGCQIYDSQTNANLYRSGVKLQNFAADFAKACNDYKDNSSDEDAYNTIMDSFIGFTEFFWEKTAMGSVKSVVVANRDAEVKAWAKGYKAQYKKETGKTLTAESDVYKEKMAELTVRDNENLHDPEWCKETYKTSCVDKGGLYANILEKYNDCSDDEVIDYENIEYDWNGTLDGGVWSLAALWEKTYKLRWDYNSKK